MHCKFEVLIAPWQKKSPEDLLSFQCVGLKEKELSCAPPAETSNNDENVNMIHEKKVILEVRHFVITRIYLHLITKYSDHPVFKIMAGHWTMLLVMIAS